MIYIGVLIIVISPPPPADSTTAPVQEQPIVQQEQPLPRDPKLIYMTCDQCAWSNGYESLSSAKQGIASHRAWCKKGHGRKKDLFGSSGKSVT